LRRNRRDLIKTKERFLQGYDGMDFTDYNIITHEPNTPAAQPPQPPAQPTQQPA